MRTYFIVKLEKPYSNFVNPNLRKRAQQFVEKYWEINRIRISSFLEPYFLNYLYAYGEDGCVYDFFSGQEIGVVPVNLSFPDNDSSTGSEFTISSKRYGEMRAYPCALEYFTREVHPFMCHKRKITSIMLEYLELRWLIRAPESEKEKKNRERVVNKLAIKEQKKVSKIERFLEQRK